MRNIANSKNLLNLVKRRPQAYARISGNGIGGEMRFYQTVRGVITVCEVSGLPVSSKECSSPIFALHIHEGNSCTGNNNDPYADTMSHYNPNGCPHPYHAGDMPPLFGVDGHAFSAFLTGRFTVKEIIGKTVIIHSSPDDFTTQPSGNSGKKIACGVIVKS